MLSKVVLVSLYITVALGNIYGDRCNPVHCPYSSTSCYECDIRQDQTCILGEAISRGNCIEPVPLSQKKSYNQKYTERCRRSNDPGSDVLAPEAYVKGCRELEFTCNDGTCEEVKGLPKICKKNIVEVGSGKCDPDKENLQDIIPNLWHTKYTEKQLQEVCKNHGGVRYNYLRCDTKWGFIQQSGCSESSPYVIPGVSECPSAKVPNVNTETLNCAKTEVVATAEACCLLEETPGECRTLIELGPNSRKNVETDQTTTGIVLELETEQTKERCCCTQACTCFGDPHCDSLFGAYEISRSTGSFTMYTEDEFSIEVTIGDPGGVILETSITMSDSAVYTIDSGDCMDSDDTPLFDPLPNGWKFVPGKGMLSRPVYHITDATTETIVVINCVLFSQNIGPNKGIHTRLDIEVLKNVPLVRGIDEALCCPAPDQVYNILQGDTGGFCSKIPEDDTIMLPDGVAFTRRRLENINLGEPDREKNPTELNDPTNGATDDQMKKIKKKANKTCENLKDYNVAGCGTCCRSKQHCIKLDTESAGGDCFYVDTTEAKKMELKEVVTPAAETRSFRTTSCYSFASDLVFDPRNRQACERGIEVQAKHKNSANWETVLFIPEGVEFCNGKLNILFKHTLVNGNPIDLTIHDVRFATCAQTDECALTCLPEVKIANMKATVLYECEGYETVDDLVNYAFEACAICSDTKGCVKKMCERWTLYV